MSQHDSPESSCPHGGNCSSCSGKFSLSRTLALFAFVFLTFALASGKLSLFPSPDQTNVDKPSVQGQLPSGSESAGDRTTTTWGNHHLSVETKSSHVGKSSGSQAELPGSKSHSSGEAASDDSLIAMNLRNLAPVAHPFTEANRLANAVRAAKKITIEYKRVGVKLPDNEMVDLTETLLRIAEGVHDRHRNDGTEFRNRERRLPSRQACYYTEFVHRVSKGSSPGACRIVIGQKGDIWYTPDHYQSFLPTNDEARDAHLQQREEER